MIVLSAATYTLELVLSAGTADVDVSYVDRTASAYPIGGTQQTAATATTQTILAAPGASTSREVDWLTVKFKTTGGVATIQKLNSSGAVTTQLISVTLLDEEVLQYSHAGGWCALDANGNRKEVTSSVFSSITVSGLTASLPVFTDANKALASNAMTGTGNVVMSALPTFSKTIGVGAATASSSGSGVSFPASVDTSTNANTLDDYEEGTWTPGVGDLTLVGDFSSSGVYTKIGRLVYITGRADGTTSLAGAAGTHLTGLPFTVATPSGIGSATNGTASVSFGVQLEAGTTDVYIVAGFAATPGIKFSGAYII